MYTRLGIQIKQQIYQELFEVEIKIMGASITQFLFFLQTKLSSSSTFFLPTVFLLILIIIPFIRRRRSSKINNKYNLPPNPPKLPIIGNLHQLGTAPHISLRNLCQKHGPIIHLQLGEIPTVVVSSARLAKEVLKTHDLSLASRPKLYGAKYLTYNCIDMGFAPYGAYWRHVRKICTLQLLSAKRVQAFSYVREQEVASLIRRIAGCYPGTANLSKMIALYANDLTCRAALGRTFSSEGGEYDKHGFNKLLEEFQVLLGGFSLGDYFPSMEWVNIVTGIRSRLVKTSTGFDRFFDEVIEEHRISMKSRDEDKDIVDVLLEIQKEDPNLRMDNVKAILLDMFAGGTDTTFTTLDWGMTELILNPRVMEKAQAEVRKIVGIKETVSESDLPQMDYLKAVIKEIFRTHPPAPLLMLRESMEDITIDGYKIPAKTRFTVNAWAISRDPESWENPEVFEPERFMPGGKNSALDYKGLDYEFIPFGSGRRMCPAQTFGIAGVELPLAQLLHSFDYELPSGVNAKDLDMTELFGITMHRISNLVVNAKPRFPLNSS